MDPTTKEEPDTPPTPVNITPGALRTEAARLKEAFTQLRIGEVPSAFRRTESCLRYRSAKLVYDDWLANPMTQCFLEVLRGMALDGPITGKQYDAASQYGVTQGLALACAVMTTPGDFFSRMYTLDDNGQSTEAPAAQPDEGGPYDNPPPPAS